MKKIISVAVACLLLFALAACGSKEDNDPIVGTWQFSSITVLGETMSAEEYAEFVGEGFSVTLTVRGDGGYTLSEPSSEDETGTWEKNADGTYSFDDQADAVVRVDGDTLEMDAASAIIMTFTRK